MAAYVDELLEMFPSWDKVTIQVILEANGDDKEKTLEQMLKWTTDDATAEVVQPLPRDDEMQYFAKIFSELGGGDPNDVPAVSDRSFYDDVLGPCGNQTPSCSSFARGVERA